MNFFKKIALNYAVKGIELDLLDPQGWDYGNETWSKISINEDSQLSISACFRAIRIIAETIGTMPLHIYEKKSDGSREKATNHYLHDLIHTMPNEYMTAVDWKESMAVSLATAGQAYNYTTSFKSTGRITSIQPVHKSRVQPELLVTGDLVYWFTNKDGQRVALKRNEICPIRGFGGVGSLEGYAPHKLMANSLGLTKAIEKYGSDFFGSGGKPSGILTTDAEFKASQRNSIRENFAKYVSESWASGKLPLLERSTKYQQVSTANNEAQFLETRKHQNAEAARIYGVPLSMLMEMDRATYHNTEQENSQFLTFCLSPYLTRIQTALNTCLLTPIERKKYYFEFDTNGLLRADSVRRAQFYKDMRVAGAITQNEIRQFENMPRIDGADDLHVPLNMAPSQDLGKILGANKNDES